jgi:hypothetical protein
MELASGAITIGAAILGFCASWVVRTVFGHAHRRQNLQIKTANGRTIYIQAPELTREKAEEILAISTPHSRSVAHL